MSSVPKPIWQATLASILFIGATSYAATVDETKAAGVMAAYLRHIAALTTWPDDRTDDDRQSILIGVVGEDPNGVMNPIRARIESNEGLLAQGRPLRLVDLAPTSPDRDALEAALVPCALLFLSEGSQGEWDRMQSMLSAMPIVTVSEVKDFAERGGMIEYFIDLGTGKVRLIVNLQSVREAGIVLSARLLMLDSVTVLDGPEED